MANEKYDRMEKPPMETVVEIGKRRALWRNMFVLSLFISVFIALVVFGVFTYAVKFHCEVMKSKENAAEPSEKETINFLWFSDLHVDLYYNASSSPDYSTSYCRNPNMLGGYVAPYGRMGCDSPKSLLRSTLYAMKEVHTGNKSPKFVLLTGDSSAHNLDGEFPDKTTRKERVLAAMKTVSTEVSLAFPSIPYFPSIGNNDLPGHYVLPTPHDSWYSDLLEFWKDSILCVNCKRKDHTTTESALRRTFLKGGYYKVELPDTKMILLVLNSMYWAKKTWIPQNYFVEIANEQMNWLKGQLYIAKKSGKKVLINSHVPPGVDTYSSTGEYTKMWLANYTDMYIEIVANRYSDVIAGQMYAHYHVDDFRLLRSAADHLYRRTSYIMLSASMSPCYDNNPNFRVVQLDRKSQTIQDYEQYYVDLLMATEYNDPVWQLDYKFSTKYPSSGKNDKVINGNRILNLINNLVNKTSNEIYTGYINSRKVRYNPGSFSRFVLYCAMKYNRADDFEECHDKFKVPGG